MQLSAFAYCILFPFIQRELKQSFLFCRLMPTTGFYQMLELALQICGRLHVSSETCCLCFSCFFFFGSFIFSFPQKHKNHSEIEILDLIVEAEVPWDGMGRLQSEDFMDGSVSTPRAGTSSSGVVEVPSCMQNTSTSETLRQIAGSYMKSVI